MRIVRLAGVALVAAAAAACGGDPGPGGGDPGGGAGSGSAPAGTPAAPAGRPAPGAPAGPAAPEADVEAAARRAAESLRQANAGREIRAVDPERLKVLLPARFRTNVRQDVQAEHVQAMGMDVAKVSARYDLPEPRDGEELPADPPSYEVEIQDIGNLKGVAAMGTAAWASQTFDRRTESGWERTGKLAGHPTHEEYDTESKGGALQVLVARRFMVRVQGSAVTMDDMRAFAEAMDLAALARLGE